MLRKDRRKLDQQLDRLSRSLVPDERLDRVGRELIRASRMSDQEAEAAVSSPFLYPRLRARIAAERELQSRTSDIWLALLRTARRPLTGMVLTTIVAALLLWSASTNGIAANNDDDAFIARETSLDRIVFTNGSSPTSDDVLGALLDQTDSDAPKR